MKGIITFLSLALVAVAQPTQKESPTNRCLLPGGIVSNFISSITNSLQSGGQQPPIYYPGGSDIFFPPGQGNTEIVYYYYDVYYENGVEYIIIPDEIYYYYYDVARKSNKKFEGQRISVRRIGSTPVATKVVATSKSGLASKIATKNK